MKTRTKILLSVFAALLLAVAIDGERYYRQTYALADQHEKYVAGKMEDLKRKFPLGTPRSAVMLAADVEGGPEAGEPWNTLVLDLGSEPSLAWYCSRWQSYAVLRFDSIEATAPLKNIELETRGMDCL